MALGQEELGLRIAQAREDANLSQPDLAARIGLKHPQSVSNYERGITEVPMKRLRLIAEATGKPLEYFLGRETPAAPAGDAEWQVAVLERMSALEEREGRQQELLHELLRLARGEKEPPQSADESSP